MKYSFFLVSIAYALMFAAGAAADTPTHRAEWQRYFESRGTSGVIALLELQTGSLSVSDVKRAQTRFVPASTFKIPNAVIALDTGVVKDEHERFAWDKVTRSISAWNRDHTIASGMRYSVVPVYQEIARRIGAERMARALQEFDYGNKDIGGGIDQFWLEGELRISALEQIEFLKKLYRNELPVSERSQRIVKDLILYEATPEYRLRGKTGYRPPIGWFVGWVEKETGVWFFALNLDLPDEKLLPDRIEIVKEVLRSESVLPKTAQCAK